MAVEPMNLAIRSAAQAAAAGLDGPTVTAFVGRTERGPIDEPVTIRSFDEYRALFGGHTSFGYVSYAVQHYFLHGGELAIIVRVANGARRARLEVPTPDGPLHLEARRAGSREHLRVSVDYEDVQSDRRRFNLVVQRLARPGSQLVEDQELFTGVSMDAHERRFIVDVLRTSQLVRLAGPLPGERPFATEARFPGEPIPYLDTVSPGHDGGELTDYDIAGSDIEGTGVHALDTIERVDLVCVPSPPNGDFGTTAFVAADRYCRRRRALLVWDPPWSWSSAEAAVLGARALALSSQNVLTYFPRLRPRGQFARVPAGLPACGAIAGLLASADALAGAPSPPLAGLKASLTTLLELGPRETRWLRRFGVNPLLRVAGGGAVIDGNVCLVLEDRAEPTTQRLDARRATLFVQRALERATRWAVREANDPAMRAGLENAALQVLMLLHARGVLAGDRANEAYFARVRRTPEGAVLRAGFAVLRPGEFQILELEFKAGRVEARDAPPLDATLLAS